MNLDKLTASIKEHEGLRYLPYTDSTGHTTIGYGCNLSAGITDAEAEFLLSNRIQLAIGEAEKMPCWDKVAGNDARENAMVEILFNLGAAKFKSFTEANAALCAGDYSTCGAELLDSLWHLQVGRRAEVLAAMIVSGRFPCANGNTVGVA